MIARLGLIAFCAALFATGGPAQAASPDSTAPSQLPVYIVDDPRCEGLALAGWNPVETAAWRSICRHLPIVADMDEPMAAGAVTRSKGELTTAFLAPVFGDSRFTAYSWKQPIRISGAYIPNLTIDTASLKSIEIKDTKIDRLQIVNTTVDTDIRIADSGIGSAQLDTVSARAVLLTNDDMQSVDISLSRFSDRIYFYRGTYGALSIAHSKADDILVDTITWKTMQTPALSITETVDTGLFSLIGPPPPSLRLHSFSFVKALWDPEPKAKLRLLSGSDYTPALYAIVAKSYSDLGQESVAQDILFSQHEIDRLKARPWTWDWIVLGLQKWLWGYGFYPAFGLVWIAAFVGIGTLVFWQGNRHIVSEQRPQSAFWFALDSVIPVIHLDRRHDDVRFAGLRQHWLYFLRFLGAILVVLVLNVLQRSVMGGGG